MNQLSLNENLLLKGGKALLLLVLSLFMSYSMVAQNLTGRVISENGESLIGANVKVKDSDKGAITDANGTFSLTLVEGQTSTLVFNYVGYETQEVVARAGDKSLVVALKTAASNLNTVIVVGYGTKSRRELTGSVASVSAKDIKEQSVTSFDQALVGKMAGVQVLQSNGAPGGNVSIRIRGISSISAGNNPLFVIDGVPVTNDTRGASSGVNSYEQPFNPLATINPSDIESIDVLKDAASAAIYGSRGSTGVILITTKRGKSGKINVSYDASVGLQEVADYVDVLDAYEYAQLTITGF